MHATIISLVVLALSVAVLFIHAKYFGKCWLCPKTMQKEQRRFKAVRSVINTFIWLSIIALIISLVAWYYQWGMEHADNVVFVL